MKKELEERMIGLYAHAPQIKVARKSIAYPIQTQFWENLDAKHGLRVKLGLFYEILTRGIFGGRWHLEQRANGHCNGTYDACKPDVTDSKSSTHFESKGVRPGGDLKFNDEQMLKYLDMQLGLSPFTNPVIRFEVYRHSIKELYSAHETFMKQQGQEVDFLQGLVIFLAESTRALIDIPFSIAWEVYEKGKDPRFGKNPNFKQLGRYEGDRWWDVTRIYPSGLDRLLVEPEEFLKTLEINPANYSFCRYTLPKGMTINDSPIVPFPILSISHKDHGSWLEGFRQGHEELRRLKAWEEAIEENTKRDEEDTSFNFGDNSNP